MDDYNKDNDVKILRFNIDQSVLDKALASALYDLVNGSERQRHNARHWITTADRNNLERDRLLNIQKNKIPDDAEDNKNLKLTVYSEEEEEQLRTEV